LRENREGLVLAYSVLAVSMKLASQVARPSNSCLVSVSYFRVAKKKKTKQDGKGKGRITRRTYSVGYVDARVDDVRAGALSSSVVVDIRGGTRGAVRDAG
jgi:hypothetical protein